METGELVRTQTQSSVVQRRGARLLGVLIVAAWLGCAIPFWMSSFDDVGVDELRDDIASGRVVAFKAVNDVTVPTRPVVTMQPSFGWPASDEFGRPLADPAELIYTVDGGRTRWVHEDVTSISGADIFVSLRDAGVRPFTDATAPPNRDWAAYPSLLTYAATFVGLWAFGARRARRGFWWLVALTPAGLGALAYAVCELIRAPEASADGWKPGWRSGLLVLVLGILCVPMLLGALA